MMQSPRNPFIYLAGMAATAALLFAVVWVWLLLKPMTYLDGAYPQWVAKDRWLQHCDLGEIVVMGDSRVAGGIIPRDLPVAVTTLAGPDGSPLDTAYIAERLAACPIRPRRVLLSLSPTRFTHVDAWDTAIRVGLLPTATIRTIQQTGARLGDESLDDAQSHDGLPHVMRSWAYGVRFPPIYLGSLLRGMLVGRAARNQELLSKAIENKGYIPYSAQLAWHGMALDADLKTFRPLPVLDAFFERTIALLQSAGIAIDFVTMPVNEATYDAMPAAVRDAFISYVAGFANRYSAFRVIGNPLPRWPDAYFGDAALHLNARGTAEMTRQFATCLENLDSSAKATAAACPLGQVPSDSLPVRAP